MSEFKKNVVVIDPDYPGKLICDVREYRPEDDDALAAGRIFSHELPLSGEWKSEESYEWGDQRVVCFARWNRNTGSVQVAKAHGSDEDLQLDSLGNLWECHWNPTVYRWDRRLVG